MTDSPRDSKPAGPHRGLRGRPDPSDTHTRWLQQWDEDVLSPQQPICDAHHHLWDFRADSIHARYLLDEFVAELNCGHQIAHTIFIECGTMWRTHGPEPMRYLGEVEFANGLAAMSASGQYGDTQIAAGIIGTAQLSDGDVVGDFLDQCLQSAGHRFRGVRQATAWDQCAEAPRHRTNPSAGLMGERRYIEGVRQLGHRELLFESWCFHPQLEELHALAQACPETTIVINHYGGPLMVGPYAKDTRATFQNWQRLLAKVASCPNVVCKVGGLLMEQNGFGFHQQPNPPDSVTIAAAMRPFFEHAIECFGVERCLFESNFPVDKISCSYRVLWNAFKRLAAPFSEDQQSALLHDNAVRIYRLGSAGA